MEPSHLSDGMFDPFSATISVLQSLLQNGTSSLDLVKSYSAQISLFNDQLRGVWSITPNAQVKRLAQQLDEERAAGNIRGPFHGIPVLIKDNIGTGDDYDLDTTAGSLALIGVKTPASSDLVRCLEKEGAIVIGKTTLSELSFWKGYGLSCGWSATAGQAQSAYVRGGVDPDDTFAGHSSPGGSSSGSAISVSAGFAPLAYGTETDGSVVMPANRAGLYSIKPTVGIASARGVVPFHPQFDTPGPMAKTAMDVAIGLDAIVVEGEKGRYARAAATNTWEGKRIGVLDPRLWQQPPHMVKPVEAATKQMMAEIEAAYDVLESGISGFRRNIDWITPEDAIAIGKQMIPLWKHGFRAPFEEYLQTLKD